MFHLRKHYFDGINPAGNALIVYAAASCWFGIKLPYSAVVFSSANDRCDEQSRLSTARFQAVLDGRIDCGLGYGETLEMDFWPQQLPLRELYWGRFVSGQHYAVWDASVIRFFPC